MVATRRIVLLLALCSAAAPHAQAQYEVEEASRFFLRALIDVRVARGDSAPGWNDRGPGKTRYGGEVVDGSLERKTRLALAQLAVEAGATLPGEVRAQLQLNLQPDLGVHDRPWLIEALLRKEWERNANGWALQAGLMHLPFSLEHVGAAWSPEYTISASALNNWLWEDISLAGLEGEWWRTTSSGLSLGVLVGAGFGADQVARLLALRGWVMGDGVSGLGTELPLPAPGASIRIFDERDDRPAAHAWLTIGDAGARASLRLGYFDSFGDQSVAGVWSTHFSTAAAVLHPHPRFELILQYLDGEARVRDPANDSSLRAYYALLSHRRGRHRVSVRYDDFRVDDVDAGNPTAERGDGVTLAYFRERGLRHRLGLEHVWLDSRRPPDAAALSHNAWQVSYRYRY